LDSNPRWYQPHAELGWPLAHVETWVFMACYNVGYTDHQAQVAAESVGWLQQRNAPGVAAIAQHIDFLSAYGMTPNQHGDAHAQCPIMMACALQEHQSQPSKVLKDVRQPLLLVPTLARTASKIRWGSVEILGIDASIDIPNDKTLLKELLVPQADVMWAQWPDAPAPSPTTVLTHVPPSALLYIKTLQHYANALPPREPLDGVSTEVTAVSQP
jgi:hypothetical protein